MPTPETPSAEAATYATPARPALAKPVVTWVLVGLNVAVFLAMVASGLPVMGPTGDQALKWGADFGPLTLDHQWWRILTSTFVHFGIIHIAFNMWCLYFLGSLAERIMGRAAYLLLYLVSGCFASVASLLWNPVRVSAGASGAIFGVAGALLAFISMKKVSLSPAAMKQQLQSLAFFIGYNLFYGAGSAGTDNAAHTGGLLMGLLCGAILPRVALAAPPDPSQPAAPPGEIVAERENTGRLALIAVLGAAAIAVGMMGARHLHATDFQIHDAEQLIEKGQPEKAIAILQPIVKSHPDAVEAQGELGLALIRAGRVVEAIGPLELAHAVAPDEPSYQLNLAIAYLNAGRYDDGLAQINHLLAAQPNDAKAHWIAGAAHLGKGDIPAAISELETAIRLNPDLPGAQNALASVYTAANRNDDALALYRKVLAKHPDDKLAQAGVASLTGASPAAGQPAKP
jgi:rhomboid protease GluP